MNDQLTPEQLTKLGICNNEAWIRNRKLFGYIDGEGFDSFFHKKHGYSHENHDIESNKRKLSIEERLRNIENALRPKEQMKYDNLRKSTSVSFTLLPDRIKSIKNQVIKDNALYVIGGRPTLLKHSKSIFTLFLVMKMEKEGPLFSSVNNGIVLHKLGSSNMLHGNRFQSIEEDYQKHLYTLTFDLTSKSYFYGRDESSITKIVLPTTVTHYPWDEFMLGYGGVGYVYDVIIFDKVLEHRSIEKIQSILCNFHDIHDFNFT